jgi:hypothetical protein
MPFPFLPGGLILAVAVLGGAFLLFGLALRAMDRTVVGIRSSLGGLVSGFETWIETRPVQRRRSSSSDGAL